MRSSSLSSGSCWSRYPYFLERSATSLRNGAEFSFERFVVNSFFFKPVLLLELTCNSCPLTDSLLEREPRSSLLSPFLNEFSKLTSSRSFSASPALRRLFYPRYHLNRSQGLQSSPSRSSLPQRATDLPPTPLFGRKSRCPQRFRSQPRRPGPGRAVGRYLQELLYRYQGTHHGRFDGKFKRDEREVNENIATKRISLSPRPLQKDPQLPIHSTAVVALSSIYGCLDELIEITRYVANASHLLSFFRTSKLTPASSSPLSTSPDPTDLWSEKPLQPQLSTTGV